MDNEEGGNRPGAYIWTHVSYAATIRSAERGYASQTVMTQMEIHLRKEVNPGPLFHNICKDQFQGKDSSKCRI